MPSFRLPFFRIPGFDQYEYAVENSSPPEGTQPNSEKASRHSEDHKSTYSSTDRNQDRNQDRYRNRPFIYPEDFDPKTHIRLLHILAVDKHKRHIVARFKRVAVSELSKESYSALSYTWGTANTDQDIHRITLCGQDFFIRDNLWKFFTTAREAWEGRLLYIDAICIDQNKPDERSEQVKLMSEIYEKADKVCAWLGAPYQDEHKKELTALKARLGHGGLGRPWSPDALFGLAHVCSRTYWTRLWVVQELLLAGNITIMYGSWRFEWDDIAKLQRKVADSETFTDLPLSWWSAWLFDPPETSKHQNHAHEHFGQGWERGWWMIYRRRAWKDGSSWQTWTADRYGFPLYEAIHSFSVQLCQDPRDKVYALLGLLERYERDGIQPDYKSSPQEVYAQALTLGLRALQRDVESETLSRGQYPDDKYQDFAADLRLILRLKQKDVEAQTNNAFRSKDFRNAFVRNCQREHRFNWGANNVGSLAEVESNILHGFLQLTEHEQSSRKAFALLSDIKGKLHFTSSAFTAARSGLFDKNKFSQGLGKQSVSYRVTVAAAQVWTRVTHWKKWKPFNG